MKIKNLYPYLLIAALSLLLYGQSFRFAYVLDDHPTIEENRFVKQGFSGLLPIFSSSFWAGFDASEAGGTYRPIPLATFAVENALFGQNPMPSHIFQVVLYVLLCISIFQYLKIVFGNAPVWVALLATLLFVSHPIHAEVVANLKSRDEILALLFGVLALLAAHQTFAKKNVVNLCFVFVFYLLSLLSKETPITFLAILPLSLYFFGTKDDKNTSILRFFDKKQSLAIGIAFAAAALFLLLRMLILSGTNDQIAPMNDLVSYATQPDKFFTRLYLLGKYFLLSVFPKNLTIAYFYNDIEIVGIKSLKVWASVLLYIGLIVFIIRLLRKNKKSILAYGLLYFLITLSLFSNLLFPIGNAFAERFLFTPSLGICVAIMCLCYSLSEVYKFPAIAIFVAGLVIIVFSFKTFSRTQAWQNDITLFLTDIKNNPESAILNRFLGNELYSQYKASGDARFLQDAQSRFEKSVQRYPQQAGAWSNLGQIYGLIGNQRASFASYQRAYQLEPTNDLTRIRLSGEYLKIGKPKEALVLIKEIKTTLYARYWYYQLALTFNTLRRFREAELSVEAGLKLPELSQNERYLYWKVLAECCETQQKMDCAKNAYQNMIAIYPQDTETQKKLESFKP